MFPVFLFFSFVALLTMKNRSVVAKEIPTDIPTDKANNDMREWIDRTWERLHPTTDDRPGIAADAATKYVMEHSPPYAPSDSPRISRYLIVAEKSKGIARGGTADDMKIVMEFDDTRDILVIEALQALKNNGFWHSIFDREGNEWPDNPKWSSGRTS